MPQLVADDVREYLRIVGSQPYLSETEESALLENTLRVSVNLISPAFAAA